MISMRFKAVFFDLDGTLIETEKLHHQVWNSLVKQLGGPGISESEYAAFIGGSARLVADTLIEKFKLPITTRGLMDHSRKMAMGTYAKAPIREGAVELIGRLKPAAKIGIATGAPRILASQAIGRIGHSFDVIVCGDEIQRPKPNPEIYLKAAELAGVKPKECAAFEDSLAGIEAAKAAGMHTIAVSSPYFSIERLKIADRVIRSFSEVSPETL